MTLFDEDILESQRLEMNSSGIPVRQVGVDWGRKGMSDDDILAELRRSKRVTFLTQDLALYNRANCHAAYCIALMTVQPRKTAEYAARFLKHAAFRTHAMRMGKVARVRPTGISYWERNSRSEVKLSWS